MTNNLLITPTLLDSFEFVVNAPPSWKARANKDFVAKLRREKTTFPAWVKKGIAFEDAVYLECNRAKAKGQTEVTCGSEHFQSVANYCLPGTYQGVVKREFLLDGEPVVLWGKKDVTLSDRVVDIKTTLKFNPSKYFRGWQPVMYCWGEGTPHFQYIIVEWKDEDSNEIKKVHFDLEIKYDDTEKLEEKILSGIKEMISYMHQHGLYDDYYFTFSKNRR